MPELPEVETMRRGILPIVGGRIVLAEAVACGRRPILVSPRGKKFHDRVQGTTVTSIGRAGKRVVIWLSSEDAIVLEPRMTGLVLVADPPSPEHLRYRIQLKGVPIREVLYWDRRGLGSVRLFTSAQFHTAFGPAKLGPDALDVSAEILRDKLAHSRREIKVGLLDQRAVAGIGNLYAAEILHLAGIHPARRCDQLKLAQWEAICAATQEVLRAAIRYEGSTLGDGTYRNALNQQGTYQNHHRVYGRAGEVCQRCGKRPIERIVQAQRSTFFCPKCQPQPRKKVAAE